ncbi:MAG: hypothetical protein IPI11_18550 [Haliscomenobacter sp.]|nr:hypothetical protein [Haliscomenobacter sp.]
MSTYKFFHLILFLFSWILLSAQQDSLLQKIKEGINSPGAGISSDLVKTKIFQDKGIILLEEMSLNISSENHLCGKIFTISSLASIRLYPTVANPEKK